MGSWPSSGPPWLTDLHRRQPTQRAESTSAMGSGSQAANATLLRDRSLVPCLVLLDPRLLAASPRHPIATFQRPRVDGPTSIGPDPPPRTAERRGPASRSRDGRAGESAAGGGAGGGDAVPCQMFHVRCAWDVGHEAAAGRAEGGWEHGWGRVERLPERCPSKKLQACTIKAQDDGLRHIK